VPNICVVALFLFAHLGITVALDLAAFRPKHRPTNGVYGQDVMNIVYVYLIYFCFGSLLADDVFFVQISESIIKQGPQ